MTPQQRSNRISHEKRRRRALAIIGEECVYCGDDNPWNLTFDHTHNDGSAHRGGRGGAAGSAAVAWILRHPEDADLRLQTLCACCHIKKDRNGVMRAWPAGDHDE